MGLEADADAGGDAEAAFRSDQLMNALSVCCMIGR
jgi:hypothetical protein